MKKIMITIPHHSFHGGVGNIYRILKLNESSEIEYFYNTTANSSANIIFSFSMLLKFIYRIRNIRLVHVNPSFDFKAVLRDGILILISKMFKKQVIVFMHGWDDTFELNIKKSYVARHLFSFVFSKVDAYILLGEVFQQKLRALDVHCKAIHYVPTVADDSYLTMREFNVPSELQTVRLLFMAGFVPSKGMDVVLESFRLLARKGSEVKFKLTMAGDGPELEKCKQIVSNKKIENVTFTGYVSGIEKHNYLESADILFLPSYTEGLPCVIMEAMLYGLAIVTRPIGGIPFWVKHNVNGWLSDSMDPEVFADGLLSLVAEPELLYAMRKTNHEIAVNNFTPDKMKIQLKHIYDSID